jgi:hypothetical protein
MQITEKQIKNFITQQEASYRRALDKKNSTGFGNLDEKTAEEQLIEICKYW